MDDEQSNGPVVEERAPVMAIVGVDAWGVAPDGHASQVKVQTATQKILLAMDFETMVNMAVVLKAAIHQCRLNVGATGGEKLTQAVPVNTYSVGHSPDVDGVLMVIDNDLPSETVYAIPEFSAMNLGQELIRHADRLGKRKQALNGVVPARRQKIILPRDVH